MPQKPVYCRPPILNVPHCFPAAGTVRTSDDRIARLYEKAGKYKDHPCLWEGLFRIACLISNKPADEPVACMIREAIKENETGAFSGTISDQICVARAAFSLFEYNTDRTILKRIAEWLRYIEIESDHLFITNDVLYRPADLMELLVRFYQATGLKSVLRLCARMRADAFDWTTALHTFQQTIPIGTEERSKPFTLPDKKPEIIDFDEKERLVNHAEILADGVRYTLYAGLFSGHRMDLSAGKTVWGQLVRHHRALCGGTTGDPFLSGNASDQPVNNLAVAAWTEAFGAQMTLSDFSWAADEMIRIIRNGLDDCLNHDNAYRTQRINTICDNEENVSDQAAWYARMTRAVSTAYRCAVSLNESGIRINYSMPGRYLVLSQKQSMILKMNELSVCFICKKPVSTQIEIYVSPITACSVRTVRSGHSASLFTFENQQGHCIRTDAEWHDQDCILFDPEERIFSEKTHHQGMAFMVSGHLLCMPSDPEGFSRAVCGNPGYDGEIISVPTVHTDKWRIRENQPADIPVLPESKDKPVQTQLKYYSGCPCRITMFPRAK